MTRLLPLLTLWACVGAPAGPAADDADPDDTDPLAPGDSDDTDPPLPDLDCARDAFPMGDVPADTCELTTLSCGQVLDGTTFGGSTVFDRGVWASATCLDYLLGDPGHLDAPERVFELDVPAGARARVTLASPCGRFDLRAVSTSVRCGQEPATCTTASGDLSRSSFELPGTATGRRWELVVDGYDGDEGNFRLSVDCSP